MKVKTRGKWLVIATMATGAMAAAVTLASGQGESTTPILHEDLTPPADQVARTAARAAERASGEAGQTMLGPAPAEGQNPQAISAGPKLLPEPSSNSQPAKGETVFGDKSFGADRDTETRPDYATGADGTLHYVEVFNPSVVPFKRMTSLDAVDSNYTLLTDSRSRTEVPVGGKRRAGRELFWGSLVVNLETGSEIAIPSVSADMGILSYEVEPKVGLVFSKDRADNYFVRTDEAGVAGKHRLVFLADAASSHFSPRVPSSAKVRDLPANLVQPLPPSVRTMAEKGIRKLGLTRNMSLRVALDELVRWHRDFEARESPERAVDIYWDLFVNQAGVCRHRAFTFMVTANALGIPTRYLANEAHAWVEVFVPTQGWVRIDLGGAALRLEVTGAEDKAMHSGGNDPFPKPAKYENNYTQLVGDIDGLTADQIEERRDGSIGSGGTDGGGSGGSGDGDVGDGDFFDESDDALGADGRDAQGRLIGPGKGLPTIPDDELVNKKSTEISVLSVSAQGYRGETIQVRGVLSSDGAGLGDQPINIFLMAVGGSSEDSTRVGVATSNADGTFAASVQIPLSFKPASYEVYAATPGDDDYAPAVSE